MDYPRWSICVRDFVLLRRIRGANSELIANDQLGIIFARDDINSLARHVKLMEKEPWRIVSTT